VEMQIAGPQVLQSSSERLDPVAVVYRMRQCLLPSSLGGWHQFTNYDRASYELLTLPAEAALSALPRHPAWNVANFVSPVSMTGVVRVLKRMVDPRWFIDPSASDSDARLLRHFHLQKCILRAIESGKLRIDCTRLIDVHNCWSSSSPITNDAGDFVRRRAAIAESRQSGQFEASKLFLRFLAKAWHQELIWKEESHTEIFLPGEFFQGREVDAWNRHRNGFRRKDSESPRQKCHERGWKSRKPIA